MGGLDFGFLGFADLVVILIALMCCIYDLLLYSGGF